MGDRVFNVEIDAEQTLILFRRMQDSALYDPTLQASAEEFVELMQQYPPERHDRQGFVNDKQRRGFFYYLRTGQIVVPYRRGSSPRSENLKTKWRVRRLTSGHWIAYNEASYADLVHGSRRTRYHRRTGWLTLKEGWLRHKRRITARWGEDTRRFIRKR